MAYCSQCGAQVAEGAHFCHACGRKISESWQEYTGGSDDRDATENKTMGVLAYIGPLVLIPIFAAKDSTFARYHANQGLVLLLGVIILQCALGILNEIPFLDWIFGVLPSLSGLAWLAFAILGILNASSGQMNPLPLIGDIKLFS